MSGYGGCLVWPDWTSSGRLLRGFASILRFSLQAWIITQSRGNGATGLLRSWLEKPLISEWNCWSFCNPAPIGERDCRQPVLVLYSPGSIDYGSLVLRLCVWLHKDCGLRFDCLDCSDGNVTAGCCEVVGEGGGDLFEWVLQQRRERGVWKEHNLMSTELHVYGTRPCEGVCGLWCEVINSGGNVILSRLENGTVGAVPSWFYKLRQFGSPIVIGIACGFRIAWGLFWMWLFVAGLMLGVDARIVGCCCIYFVGML